MKPWNEWMKQSTDCLTKDTWDAECERRFPPWLKCQRQRWAERSHLSLQIKNKFGYLLNLVLPIFTNTRLRVLPSAKSFYWLARMQLPERRILGYRLMFWNHQPFKISCTKIRTSAHWSQTNFCSLGLPCLQLKAEVDVVCNSNNFIFFKGVLHLLRWSSSMNFQYHIAKHSQKMRKWIARITNYTPMVKNNL